jgi:hypothetical protein
MPDYQVTVLVTLKQTVAVTATDADDAAFEAEYWLDCDPSEIVGEVEVVKVEQELPPTLAVRMAALAARDQAGAADDERGAA